MEQESFVLEAEIICLANAGAGVSELFVWAFPASLIASPRRRPADRRLLFHKPPFETAEQVNKMVLGEKFVAHVRRDEAVLFELKRARSGTGIFKKNSPQRGNFSVLGSTLAMPEYLKGKVTHWYEFAPRGGESVKSPAGKKSWGRSKSGGLQMMQITSLLVCFSTRVTGVDGKLRLSKSSSTGSEGATIAQRRAMIIQEPIEEISTDALVMIYKQRGRARRSSSISTQPSLADSLTSVPASASSSSSASLASSKESINQLGTYTDSFPVATPVYIDLSDVDDEDEDEELTSPVRVTSPTPSMASSGTYESFNGWNSDYQALLEEFSAIANQGSHTRHDTRLVAMELAKLESDFLSKAEQYGRIIISELFLDVSKKTIKPEFIGGSLGGAKYVVENAAILFKVPDAQMFLNEQLGRSYSEAMGCANKVAGRELSGIRILSSYFAGNKSSVRVSLPLACVIDYLGYRLLCMSILPISPLTLKHGSADAGTECNVHMSDPTLAALLDEMGSRLNLETHRVSAKKNTTEVEMRTPVDLEGHKGFDGRYYLVDTSRLLPPTCLASESSSDKTRIFYENFRTEMMSSVPPLSPDALSKFVSRQTPESTRLADLQDQDILLATEYLLGEHLKEACKKLLKTADMNPYIDAFDLVAEIHSLGINVRYLGLLAPHIESSAFLLNWLRCESMARAVKNKVRSLLRAKFKEDGAVAGSNFQETVAQFLDSCFCLPADLWRKEHGTWLEDHLVAFHRFSREHAEQAVAFLHSDTPLYVKRMRDAKKTAHSPLSYTLLLVCEYSSIMLEPSVFEAIRSGQRHFDNRLLALTYMDVSLQSRVKHLPLIELCTGFILYQQAIAAQTGSDSAKLDYLKRAHQAVSRGLHACPNDSALLTLEGDILSREMIIRKKMPQHAGLAVIQNVYLRCLTAYERAIEQDGDNVQAMIKLATIYAEHGNSMRAEELFITALEVDSCNVDALRRYGDFVSINLMRPNEAEPFYLRRQKILSSQQGAFKKISHSQSDLPQLAPRSRSPRHLDPNAEK